MASLAIIPSDASHRRRFYIWDYGKADQAVALKNQMYKLKGGVVAGEDHIVKLRKPLRMRKDPLMQLLAAALRPKEQDHAHRAAAGGQAAEHRDDGQQVLIRSGGDETGQIDRQRKTEKDRCFGDLPLPLVLQISVLTLFRLLLFHDSKYSIPELPQRGKELSNSGRLTAVGALAETLAPAIRGDTAAFVSVPYSDVGVKKSFASGSALPELSNVKET